MTPPDRSGRLLLQGIENISVVAEDRFRHLISVFRVDIVVIEPRTNLL